MKAVGIFFFIILLVFIIQVQMYTEREEDNRNHYSRSITSLHQLLKVNRYLIDNLNGFIQYLQQKLDVIKLGIEDMRDRHKRAETNIKRFVENSLNSFSLLRHMESDWLYWQLFMENFDSEALDYMKGIQLSLANENDFIDAAEAMRRLQKVYRLSPLDMAKGLLDGVQYNVTLSPLDCYAMAKYNMNKSFWQSAELWLLATIWSFGQPSHRPEILKLHGFRIEAAYDELARVHINQYKYADALDAQRAAFDLSPRNATLLQKLNKMEKEFLTYRPMKNDSVNNRVLENEDEIALNNTLPFCCSGKCEKPKSLQLYCLYKRTVSDFLRLAPVKMEILSLDPFVVLYHDIISTREQELLKEISKKNLTVTETVELDSDKTNVNFIRTAKGVWYDDDEFYIFRRITQRIEGITNLNITMAEPYQIINYGVGGLFENHSDLLLSHENRHKDKIDRISTMIFYLNEVPQGGATLMINLNLTIFPQAGSALFFYNLDNAGDEIIDVIHTGCPVIVGSKWIMTKWIFDRGQEFRKPCYKI